MKVIGEHRPTPYPYVRIEGEVREEFLRRHDPAAFGDATNGDAFALAMELSEKPGHGGSPEHVTYVQGFVRGLRDGVSGGTDYIYAPTVEGEEPCRDANRHHQNGHINGGNTRREMAA